MIHIRINCEYIEISTQMLYWEEMYNYEKLRVLYSVMTDARLSQELILGEAMSDNQLASLQCRYSISETMADTAIALQAIRLALLKPHQTIVVMTHLLKNCREMKLAVERVLTEFPLWWLFEKDNGLNFCRFENDSVIMFYSFEHNTIRGSRINNAFLINPSMNVNVALTALSQIMPCYNRGSIHIYDNGYFPAPDRFTDFR